ncbi:MAG: NAD kinase [Cytophagales bacterium]|nr:NAD kinase [Cytophagales bacterium]
MKIGVHGKDFGPGQRDLIRYVFELLAKSSSEIVVSHQYFSSILDQLNGLQGLKTYQPGDDLKHLDTMLTLGGDGTLLEAVTHVGCAGVPILGINTGRLGFLATTAKDSIESALEAMFSQDYDFDERTLIHLDSNNDLFDGINFALNDFTILKKDTSSMIVVHTYIDGEFLNSYWADGVIVSTPTGSTGYSISCGGPLVLPQSDNFIITPVSPHNLTVRPIVVPDSSRLSFTIEGRSNSFLISLDSRFETVDNSIRLEVTKEKFKTKLVKLKDNNYFKTLRQKLNWGLDVRN